MSNLSKLPNIGKTLEDKLKQVGITSAKELKASGTENAFARIHAIDPTACINMLYALEGAVQGIRWHRLSKEKKQELLEFLNLLKKL